jgi:prepilin-type N-terminal cleavage/methylation domain-containing protein
MPAPSSFHSGVRRTAFTLLELMIVVVVLGLLMGLALPRFAAFRDAASVRAALADLGSCFSVARQSAITRRTAVAVVFDTISSSVVVRSAGLTLVRHSLGAEYGIVLGANRDSAVYDARGIGYGVSNITVTIRRGTMVDTLTMSRLGRVRW